MKIIPQKSKTIISLFTIFLSIGFCDKAFAGLFDDATSGEIQTDVEDESDSSSTGFTASAGGFNFELNGYIRAATYIGKVPDESDAEVKNAFGEGALKLFVRKAPYGDAYTELRFNAGFAGNQKSINLDLRESYVNLYLWRFDLRLGHQIIVWGRADGINPTNNLTPTSMLVRSPNEDDKRLANFGLRVFFNYSPIRIEGVWLPLYAASEIPTGTLPETINLSDDFPDASLSNSLGAGRFHLELPEIEMSVSYLFGYAPMFGLDIDSVDFSTGVPKAMLLKKPYRQHVVGYDFSAPISDWFGLRGEVAYRHPYDYDNIDYAPNPDLYYILGIDKEFAGQVSIIAQYIGRYVFEWEEVNSSGFGTASPALPNPIPDPVKNMIRQEVIKGLAKQNQLMASHTEQIQHSAFMRIEWKLLHETLSLEAMGMVNFSTWEWMIRPKITYDITDALEFCVGAEVNAGPNGTLFGMIEEVYSAGFVQFMASF